MHYDYLFVLTYGRSGSTLLQGVLNSIPGVLVRGENNSALRAITRAWRSLSIADAGFAGDTLSPKHAWFGMAEWDRQQFGEDLAAAFVRNVLKPHADTRAVGFKEIRYFLPLFEPDFELDFMRRFFPRAGFIVNTRNLDDTYASMSQNKHAMSREQLEISDTMLRALAVAPDVIHVHYDDYSANPEALRPMFDFLGAEFDAEALGRLMSDRYSIQSRIEPQQAAKGEAQVPAT